jgi:hypothetical protein
MMDDHYKRVGANKISSNYGGHPNLHGVYMIGTARGGGESITVTVWGQGRPGVGEAAAGEAASAVET